MPITNTSKNYTEQNEVIIEAKVLKNKTLLFQLTSNGVIDSRYLTVEQGLELASKIENAVMDMNMQMNGVESAEDYFIRFEDCLTPQQYADLQMAETKEDKHRGDGHE
jgi:hypothetical protein|tara:strand:- start:568 stop:891 length:324 start_codon:yes stop_codon:yes gene_type:complete